jgi:hypothetical protein
MKRRTLFISLTLALMMAALAPATALADSGWHRQGPATTNFSGSGQIFVTSMPDPIIQGKVWRYQGEIVEGFLDQSDWDLLAGTVFWSEHDSIVRVDEEYNAAGTMRGTFTLTRPDGTGTLQGTFTGRIQGNLYTGDITDEGTWGSTGGTGVFQGVKAWGQWSAELHFGIVGGQPTLVGPVNWSGKYISYTKIKDKVKDVEWKIKDKARKDTKCHVKYNVKEKMREHMKWNVKEGISKFLFR